MLNRRTVIGGAAALAGAVALRGSAAEPSHAQPATVPGCSSRLPRFEPGARLVFQGDSITDMNRGRNESDRNHYLGHGYVYLIAARLGVDMPAAKLEFFNRGVGSQALAHLKGRWDKDAIDLKPDLLSILIGVNDVWERAAVNVEPWEADYRLMLDASRKANPDLRLVLLDPFVLPSGRLADPAKHRQWRGMIDQLIAVVARLARDYGAVHVKTQEVFDAAAEVAPPEHWIWDGVHPLPQGHELIARRWLEEVSGAPGKG